MHYFAHLIWRSVIAYIQKVKRKQDINYLVFIKADSKRILKKPLIVKELQFNLLIVLKVIEINYLHTLNQSLEDYSQ